MKKRDCKLGIDIGGSHILIGVIDSKYEIIEEYEERFNKGNIVSKEEIISFIEDVTNKVKEKYNICKIGISVAGLVKDNIILKSVNLQIIEPLNLKKILEQKLKTKVHILNDCKAASIGEYVLKDSKKQDLIFLTLGTGIGLSIIQNGRLQNIPLEIGHTVFEKEGRLCKCGKKGCIEKYCSMKALKDDIRLVLNKDYIVHGEEIYEILKEKKFKNEDEKNKIEKIENEFVQNLTIMISNIVNIFGIYDVKLGGSFIYFKDLYLEKLNTQINDEKNKYIFAKNKVKIEDAKLGNKAGVLGAVVDL